MNGTYPSNLLTSTSERDPRFAIRTRRPSSLGAALHRCSWCWCPYALASWLRPNSNTAPSDAGNESQLRNSPARSTFRCEKPFDTRVWSHAASWEVPSLQFASDSTYSNQTRKSCLAVLRNLHLPRCPQKRFLQAKQSRRWDPTFTSAGVLISSTCQRGPSLPPTDTMSPHRCAVRALTPTSAVCPPHVCRLGQHVRREFARISSSKCRFFFCQFQSDSSQQKHGSKI